MERQTVMIFVYAFEMVVSFCFYSRIYQKKIKSNALILLIGLLLFIPASLVFNLFENEIINLIVFFIINFVFSLICFDISVKNAAAQSVILDAMMYSSEIIAIFVLSCVLHTSTDEYKNDTYALLIAAVICKLVYFIVSQLFSMIILKIGHNDNSLKRFVPLFVFPVLTLISCTLFLYTALRTQVTQIYKITTTAVCILYIIAGIFIFVYYQVLASNELKISELESEKRLYDLNKTYMGVLEHQNDELNMMFHDTKNHYIAISSFDNIEDVRRYVNKICKTYDRKNTLCISNNKMLDLILNKYIVVCSQKGIKFDYEVKTADLSYIDDSELSIILNNILDNAVEAAENSSEKRIEFSLRHVQNNMDLLSVINSCDNPPRHNDRQLLTSKSDADKHGFGTKIIKKHVKSNNGRYEWKYDEQSKEFHLTVMFQMNKAPEPRR